MFVVVVCCASFVIAGSFVIVVAIRCLSCVACCWLPVLGCVLLVVCCLLCGVCCWLFLAC